MSFEEVYFLGASSGGLLTAVFTAGHVGDPEGDTPAATPPVSAGPLLDERTFIACPCVFCVLFFSSLVLTRKKKTTYLGERMHTPVRTCAHYLAP